MGTYIKYFETTAEYNAYTSDKPNFIKPNVSLINEANKVKYNPFELVVEARFNVTSTSDPTIIIGEHSSTPFSSMKIDDVKQESVVSAYTFTTTGEHTVTYKLTDKTTLPSYTFYECSALTSVSIPAGVTSIGDRAFYYCSGLTSMTINAATPPTLVLSSGTGDGNWFTDTNNCPIYVPSGSVNAYKSAQYWSNYASRIQAIP